MARVCLMDLTLVTSALVLGLTLMTDADTDVSIPTECPKLDAGSTIVNLIHERGCSKYYVCVGGKKYLKECPTMDEEDNRLHFDPVLQVCKPSEPSAMVMSGDEIPTECPKFESKNFTVHLPHETDCTKFYTCSHGRKCEMICPVANEEGDRLHFNPVLQVCDWPDRANCTLNTPCIGTCPKEDNITFIATLPHKSDCKKYCLCEDGDALVKDCPFELYFSVVTGVCGPSGVGCYADTETTATASKTSSVFGCIGSCPSIDPVGYDIYLPNKNCAKFCKCRGGRAYVLTCPASQRFSSTLRLCTGPNEAKCGNGK